VRRFFVAVENIEMQEQSQENLTPLPTGDGTMPVEESNLADAPLDSFEESVLAELDKIRNPKGGWVRTLLILAVSLLLFVALGTRNNPITFTAMLVGVLFFHEMGHYVGMRIFGYRNVRMFFIPFFGAAVSGQKTDVKSYQEAIVTLLGPLPGLCLAAVLIGVTLVPGIDNEVRRNLLWASTLLGLINGFNLLPVFPLDGGRFLNQTLFSRNHYLEGIFQFLAALAFIAYGAAREEYLFLFLGGAFLVNVGPKFKTNLIAHHLGGRLGDELPRMSEPIPPPIFRAIVAQVKSLLPRVKTAKGMAGVVFNVWERMHARPPAAVATVSLLLVYVSFCAAPLALYLAAIHVIELPFQTALAERSIARYASESNKRLPMQLDKITRWERVEPGPGKSYSNVYTLSKVLTETQKRALTENTTRRALASPEMRTTFAAGITVWYRYYDTSGRKLLEFSVKK
jgi:Zn-dependent protease